MLCLIQVNNGKQQSYFSCEYLVVTTLKIALSVQIGGGGAPATPGEKVRCTCNQFDFSSFDPSANIWKMFAFHSEF